MVIRNVSVVTELVEEMYKVDLFVDQRDEPYIVDWVFEYQIRPIDGKVFQFIPDEFLKSITLPPVNQ